MKIGVLHPGEMGSSVARALGAAGHDACWVRAGRSAATLARAEGLTPFDSLEALVANVHAIVSVCPPAAALAQAQAIKSLGFENTYVDANAVSPATAREIAATIGEAYVDGGIIGPPADQAGTTRLYVSGTRADEVLEWFAGSFLDARKVGDDETSASALKMAYAAYTKGSSALLLAVNALAERAGVADALQAEWDLSQPGLSDRSRASARGTSRKAWRFVGEMQEIASTFADVDLPDGFHDAAAEIYARMSALKDAPPADLDTVVQSLLSTGETRDT